jgi:predicted glycosyltransferase
LTSSHQREPASFASSRRNTPRSSGTSNLHETLKMRQSIIRHTAETFQPDIFIVDKEPLGLLGEIEETLSYLKSRGTAVRIGRFIE